MSVAQTKEAAMAPIQLVITDCQALATVDSPARRETLRELVSKMREDARATYDRDPAAESVADVVLFSTGLRIVWSYRVSHWLWTRGHRFLAKMRYRRARRRYAADIHPAARIGRRFTVDHGTGVVIGSTSVIGDDCLIYQGVTLGMTGKHAGRRHPSLGDGVMVGANAIVLGAIHIGDGAKVGAGAVVLEPVPAHATAVGVPARVI